MQKTPNTIILVLLNPHTPNQVNTSFRLVQRMTYEQWYDDAGQLVRELAIEEADGTLTKITTGTTYRSTYVHDFVYLAGDSQSVRPCSTYQNGR